MRTMFNIIMAVGVILALGCVGTSDLEVVTGQQLISTGQLILRLALSAALVFAAYYGKKRYSGQAVNDGGARHSVSCESEKTTACI